MPPLTSSLRIEGAIIYSLRMARPNGAISNPARRSSSRACLACVSWAKTPTTIACAAVVKIFSSRIGCGVSSPCFTLAFWLLHQSIHTITLNVHIPFTLDTSFFSPHAVRDLLHLLELTFVNRDLSGSLDLLGDRNLLPAHGNSDDFILANGRIGNLTRTRTMFDIHFLVKNGYINGLLLGHNFFVQPNFALLNHLLVYLQLLLA